MIFRRFSSAYELNQNYIYKWTNMKNQANLGWNHDILHTQAEAMDLKEKREEPCQAAEKMSRDIASI